MPKRAQRGPETRPVSFRMPLDVYKDLTAVAESRGVDLSAVLNWMCAEYRPVLLEKKAAQQKAMLQATAAKLSEAMSSESGTGESVRLVRELLKQLQDVYASLSKRELEEDARRAG